MVIIVIIVATSMLVVTKMVTGWSLEMIDVNCLEMAITLAARMAATRLRADISLKLVISDRQLSLVTFHCCQAAAGHSRNTRGHWTPRGGDG